MSHRCFSDITFPAISAWHQAPVHIGRRELTDVLLELPAAPHSWPIGDEARFVDVIKELTSGDRRPVRAR